MAHDLVLNIRDFDPNLASACLSILHTPRHWLSSTKVTEDGVLEGARVRLRPVRPEDIGRLGEIVQQPGVAEWWPGYSEDRLRDDILGEKSEVTAYVIEFTGSIAGFIWYYEEDDPQYRMAGIDISLDCKWHNRGLGTDALRVLARHLFEDRGHHRIIIDPAVPNERAVYVYKKVGFKPVGVMRSYERLPDGSFRDGLLMDMLPEDLVPA